MARDMKKGGMIAAAVSTHNEYGYFYNEEVVPFGAGVMRGTDSQDQCKLMLTTGKFVGVALYRNVNLGEKREYPLNSTVEVLKKGQVWVKVAEAVLAGDVAGCGLSGKFGKNGTTGYDEINGIYQTSANKDEYAILELK